MKRTLFSLSLCLFFFLLLLFPAAVQSGAKEGLFLWYDTIVPILFPFLLFSNLLLSTGALQRFFSLFSPLLSLVSSNIVSSCYALLFGWLCGYPLGAKTLSDLVRREKITRHQADFLLPAANQASPMFLAGYLGVTIFEGRYPTWKIFLCIYLPVFAYLLLGGLFLSLHSRCLQKTSIARSRKNVKKNSVSFSMEHTILDSFETMICIGVYMMLFTILMRLGLLFLPKNRFFSLLLGFLEMSTGISWLSRLSFLSQIKRDCLVLSCASFGGFCIAAQTFSVTEQEKLSLPGYFLGKAVLSASVFLLSHRILF
jgi:sporulation integral membrane protein YlbJ